MDSLFLQDCIHLTSDHANFPVGLFKASTLTSCDSSLKVVLQQTIFHVLNQYNKTHLTIVLINRESIIAPINF